MKREKLLLTLVLIIIFLVHSGYINNGFTWLDHGDIEGGRAVLPLSRLQQAFFTRFGETNFYRPLVTILNSTDVHLYGRSAQGFHLTNISLYLLVVVATFYFVRTFFELSKRESLFIAFVVGIHPLTILPVGAISYRQELLTVMFTFVTITTYLKFFETKKRIWIIVSLFFWLLALFSKETALFWVPGLIFIWESSQGFENLRQQFKYFLAFLFTAIFYIILRIQTVPEFWTEQSQNLNLNEAIGTRLSVFLSQLLNIIVPFQSGLSDATLITKITTVKPILAILILFAGLILVLRNKKNSILFRLVFFVLIMLLPALSIIPLPRFNSPHYGFIAAPAAGVIVILIAGFITNKLAKSVFLIFISTWLLIMIVSTFRAGFQFKDDFTLFNPEVKKDNNFKEGHFYLGDYYLRRGNFKEAEKHLEVSLQENPKLIAFVDRSAAMTNLAGAYLAQQKFGKAEKLLEELIKKSSGNNRLMVLYNLAVISERKSDYEKVVNLLKNEVNQWQEPQPLLLYVKGLVKIGRESDADNILKNKLFVIDKQKRQEIIQSAR
ncbi:hypothetical protein A2767_07520 [Candidatus Roizmanbacteria bacterium RIFCSPHIGHO2_01_FULL_35_10]|uniref:Uncharacterized protein n=1 Tax=Candidatus Roizmanbacteria bacterium RIFCSPLOWO2_01_FULL_35_13 TaxID=1802055 RepID=A0A1F7ICN0_9BACT|nr:MAG: hypothetical protein A2767_07520 [Candidatus Roizmanbacteria bacterium RIFCSPHIGHO2_01_FULL_35_10]OGK41118.1 MAG: hypothetical protein A3A74_02120 [Candidatus Roizmanbacteria bacterium RIFCSPLOWO2_01_FULL_35_13]